MVQMGRGIPSSALYAEAREKHRVRKGSAYLTSFGGAALSDSPFYLLRELMRDGDIEVVTPSHDAAADAARFASRGLEPRVVSWGSREHMEALATSEFLVTNATFPRCFSKAPGQKVLNTWHGTPLKSLGYDMRTPLGELGNTQGQFMMADALLYPNDFTRTRIMGSYHLDRLFGNEVLMCGYPRTGVLLDKERRERVRSELGLGGSLVVAYMPTWRGAGTAAVEDASQRDEVASLLEELDNAIDEGVVVFTKLHYYLGEAIPFERYDHIRAFPEGLETYDALGACDVLVTDYSSVLFDFAATGRPVVLFQYDREDYLRERGTYIDPAGLPFAYADTPRRLAEILKEVDINEPVSETYRAFMECYCPLDKEDNARRVANAFFRGERAGVDAISFADNRERPWRVVVGKGATGALPVSVEDLGEGDLVVFGQDSFSAAAESALRALLPDVTPFIAIGGNALTVVEAAKQRIRLRLPADVRRRELSRLLPGIRIAEVAGPSGPAAPSDVPGLLT